MMQSATEYLHKTESAVRLLFSGVNSYLDILRGATGVTFVTGEPYGSKQNAKFAVWQHENAAEIEAARKAMHEFAAESFALNTLCGSILQIAEMALKMYGTNSTIPPGLPNRVKNQYAKFCVGRVVRTIPLGLIVYAARNQHTHFDDPKLGEPSASVFRRLATAHGYGDSVDPTFDLENPSPLSFASNITSLIEWRTYEQFATDMRSMLETGNTDMPTK